MKIHLQLSTAVCAAAMLVAASVARADLTAFSDRSVFSAQGAIAHNYGFEDVNTSGAGFYFPGEPWTAADVTYITAVSSDTNVIVGPSAGFGLANNVYVNNSASGTITANIAGAYDLFGFDLGTIAAVPGTANADIVLTTSLGVYSFLNQSLPAQPGLSFFGFRAMEGEYFTSFTISSLVAGRYPMLDNVTLGAVMAPVPEPEIYAMLGLGLGFLGWAGRRRRFAQQ